MRVKIKEISILRLVKYISRRIIGFPARLSFVYSRQGMRNRKRLFKFKDVHKGETCILLANGPSLSKEDLSITKKYKTIGLNRIYLGIEKYNIELDYLVCVNELVLEQFAEEIENVNVTKFLSWGTRRHFKVQGAIHWVSKGLSTRKFSNNLVAGLNPAATVTYAALQIIYYMGFDRVIILGMDHNFQLDKSKTPNTKEVYSHSKDVNHFIDNYFPKGVKWETPDLMSSEYFYTIARDHFDRNGREIFDCTSGGKCEVFKKGNATNVLMNEK